jgi:hypothetical protein
LHCYDVSGETYEEDGGVALGEILHY